MSKSEFDELAFSLKEGEEALFETIFLSHFKNCQQFLVTNHHTSYELAYDITMDTLIQFRQKIITDKIQYGNLRYLFTKMASQNLFKNIKKEQKEDLSMFYVESEPHKSEVIYEALSSAWSELESETKKILEEYYYNKTPLIKIAKTLGIADSTMRKKKQRCLDKLRNIFMQKYKLTNEKEL